MIKSSDPIIVGLDSCVAIELAAVYDFLDLASKCESNIYTDFLNWIDSMETTENGTKVPCLKKDDLDVILKGNAKLRKRIEKLSLSNGKESWLFAVSSDKGRFYNLENIIALLDLFNNQYIKFVLTPTAIGELNLNRHPVCKKFYERCCTHLIVPDEHAGIFAKKVDSLAREYVKNNVMSDAYFAVSNQRGPENDAYMMAQWSVLGIFGITINKKDFIFGIYNNGRNVNDIREGVKNINIQQGYLYSTVNNSNGQISPVAYTLGGFLEGFRKDKITNLLGQLDPNREKEHLQEKIIAYCYTPVPYGQARKGIKTS